MVNLGLIVGFDWDGGNSRNSVDKHDVNQMEAEQVFSNAPLLLLDDHEHSADELRNHAYGRTDADRLLQISFTLRANDTRIRVISARPMSKVL